MSRTERQRLAILLAIVGLLILSTFITPLVNA